jgi:cyanophycin synthetase
MRMDLSQSKRRMEDQDRTCHSCAFNTGGKAKFKCSGSNLSQLCLGFKTKILACPYNPSAAQTPDEWIFLNLKFKVLIDFAHNASGYRYWGVQSVDATKRLELLLVLVIVAMRTFGMCLLPRECLIISLFDKKIFKRKNRRRNNQSNTRGDRLFRSRRDLKLSQKKRKQQACYKICRGRKLYHLLADVVINAIEIVRVFLDREI